MKIIENDFGLPKVSEELDKEEFEYRNRYRDLYIKLINKCRNMTDEELSGCNEKHHIIPRCMGGSDESENLVLMPVKHHIMAHMILYKIYPDNYKVGHALYCIMTLSNDSINRKESIEKDFSLRTVTAARKAGLESIRSEESRKHRSEVQMGENNSNYGKHWDEDHKKTLSEKSKLAWARGDFEKYKDRINQPRGESWCAKKVVGPDGVVYDCLLDAVESSGIPSSTLRGWMKRGPEGKNGWHYLNPIDSLKLKDKKEYLKSHSD